MVLNFFNSCKIKQRSVVSKLSLFKIIRKLFIWMHKLKSMKKVRMRITLNYFLQYAYLFKCFFKINPDLCICSWSYLTKPWRSMWSCFHIDQVAMLGLKNNCNTNIFYWKRQSANWNISILEFKIWIFLFGSENFQIGIFKSKIWIIQLLAWVCWYSNLQ